MAKAFRDLLNEDREKLMPRFWMTQKVDGKERVIVTSAQTGWYKPPPLNPRDWEEDDADFAPQRPAAGQQSKRPRKK
jgi:hypothetical protein